MQVRSRLNAACVVLAVQHEPARRAVIGATWNFVAKTQRHRGVCVDMFEPLLHVRASGRCVASRSYLQGHNASAVPRAPDQSACLDSGHRPASCQPLRKSKHQSESNHTDHDLACPLQIHGYGSSHHDSTLLPFACSSTEVASGLGMCWPLWFVFF